MTLGVLAAYRRLGVATALLEHVLKVAREKGAKQVSLHAWVENQDGIKFYEKHGFSVIETLPGYYKNLSPPDGVVLALDIK